MEVLLDGGKTRISLKEMNERVSELLKQSIKSDGVINLFEDVNEESERMVAEPIVPYGGKRPFDPNIIIFSPYEKKIVHPAGLGYNIFRSRE